MSIFEEIGVPIEYIVLGTASLLLIFIVLQIIYIIKVTRMKKRYNILMSGKDGKSLEDIIMNKIKLVNLLDESVKDIYAQIKQIDNNLLITYQKMGFVKYDAFKESGGRMSYVLVLLTKENNGILMNCMHSNTDGCYTYTKRIERGSCKLTLSKEEETALEQAIKNEIV